MRCQEERDEGSPWKGREDHQHPPHLSMSSIPVDLTPLWAPVRGSSWSRLEMPNNVSAIRGGGQGMQSTHITPRGSLLSNTHWAPSYEIRQIAHAVTL